MTFVASKVERLWSSSWTIKGLHTTLAMVRKKGNTHATKPERKLKIHIALVSAVSLLIQLKIVMNEQFILKFRLH